MQEDADTIISQKIDLLTFILFILRELPLESPINHVSETILIGSRGIGSNGCINDL